MNTEELDYYRNPGELTNLENHEDFLQNGCQKMSLQYIKLHRL